MTQTCKKCLVEKPLDDYHIAANTKSGKHSVCKPCRSEYMRGYHAEKKALKASSGAAPKRAASSGTE